MILNSLYSYYNGVGTGSTASSLPQQNIPDSKKTEKWKKRVMDSLEQIAIRQSAKNIEFRDYYRMQEGRLVYSDFEAAPEIVKDIASIRQEMDLPTYIKHYDLIGLIANQLAGELDSNKDKMRVDSTDLYSQNDYLRERGAQINGYMKSKFDMEIKIGLAKKGINPDEDKEFESQEEQQQYMQFLQEEANKIVPLETIEKNLNKNFKIKAVTWTENTLEEDTNRFGINHKEELEFIDYFLTGRYFRHFHIGYDYYMPESWKVEETFFSEDLGIKYPQDGEYVGRCTWMSGSDIITRYGDKLSLKLQEKIGKVYDNSTDSVGSHTADYTTMSKRPVDSVSVPHEGYMDHQLNVQLQDAFGVPAGESTYVDDNGEVVTSPDWLSDYRSNEGFLGNNASTLLRDDIDVRRDSFRLTEAYFRSFKRMGYLRYRTPSGVVAEEMVTDDILGDFLKENEIRKIKNISLEDFEEGDEVNVIAYFYIPEVWKGKKIGAGGGGILSEDIYFDIKPLEFQIKGEGNMFDVKLPVSGIITNSYARKIRPYQMGYNLCMNQIFNLLEKEIGMFFLMDISFLPSEYKNMGDSAEILGELRELARDLGFIPVDTSKQNMQGANPQANSFIKQDISYDAQINRRAVMADFYKKLALEQIGITEQRKGSPNQYATNEGIKVGQEASYAQTKLIFNQFNEARKKSTELHINIAQYCQSGGRDISTYSRKSDGDLAYLDFTDPYFPLRDIGVRIVSDSKSRKSLERLREQLLANNTAGNDMLDFANIIFSDSATELVNIGKESRRRQEESVQEERAHEEKLMQMQIQAKKEDEQVVRDYNADENDEDRENRLDVERIKALGRASDKKSDQAGFEQINKAADRALKEQEQSNNKELQERGSELKERELEIKQKESQELLRLKLMELKDKREQRKHERFVATVNKN